MPLKNAICFAFLILFARKVQIVLIAIIFIFVSIFVVVAASLIHESLSLLEHLSVQIFLTLFRLIILGDIIIIVSEQHGSRLPSCFPMVLSCLLIVFADHELLGLLLLVF